MVILVALDILHVSEQQALSRWPYPPETITFDEPCPISELWEPALALLDQIVQHLVRPVKDNTCPELSVPLPYKPAEVH
jgi:hypothetical protein